MLGRIVDRLLQPRLSQPFSSATRRYRPKLSTRLAQAPTPSRLLEVYAKECHGFGRLHLAMTANYLGKLRVPSHRYSAHDKQLFAQLTTQLLEHSAELTPRDLANAVHGLAKVRAPDAVLQELAQLFVLSLDPAAFSTTELVMVVHAFATARFAAELSPVFAHAESELLVRLASDADPQHAANMLWSYATAGAYASPIFDAVEEYVLSADLAAFKPQELSNVVWSYMRSHVQHSSPVFAAVGAHLAERGLQGFTPQNVANVVAAFAKADQPLPDAVLEAAVEHLQRDLPAWLSTPQNTANLLWALSILEATHLVDSDAVLRGLSQRLPKLQLREKCQVHQFMLEAMTATGEQLHEAHAALFQSTRAAMHSDQDAGRSGFLHSGLARLSAALAARRIPFDTHVRTELGYEVDVKLRVAVAAEVRGVVVMIDGPSRFVRRQERGRSLMKKRHLRAFGYHVVSFPYYELTDAAMDDQLDQIMLLAED
ncbi:hypothetical protein ACHHYP_03134 [Achlya hypogyna]|uniref:RAP domain-containing protein n=1 Tax=Achlya hypogyna TaxID=1202772 RepID=A0A1V9Z4M5_ACHHY|nr:hypothetical protein ACHHYP_03134 [Achlya hypogyna]